jgi:flagellar FliL protein
MATARPAPAAGEEAAPAPRRGRRRLLVLGLGVLLLLGGAGGGAWWLWLRPRPAPAPKAARPPEHVVKIGTIVVNVAGSEGRRYLRATVEVGATAKAAAHAEHGKAPLVDAAISVLAGKDLPALLDVGRRDELRRELRDRLDHAVHGGGITHVFLTEFVVQ